MSITENIYGRKARDENGCMGTPIAIKTKYIKIKT